MSEASHRPGEGGTISLDAPAKVNLFLNILAREESGFHGLETLFCGISLADRIEIELTRSSGIHLEVEGDVETGPAADNLATRAADAYFRKLGGEPRLRILLTKRVPAGAGLGGGSSDAAAVLRGLDGLHGGAVGRKDLLEIAVGLGSDVPFFLASRPLALAWSRGERMLGLPPLPSRPVLVAYPSVPLSTADAYTAVARQCGGYRPRPRSIDSDDLGSWERLTRLAHNDFEPYAVERIPLIGDLISRLRSGGADPALLTGSGSAVFGVFASIEARDRTAGLLAGRGARILRASTLESWPLPLRGVAAAVDHLPAQG